MNWEAQMHNRFGRSCGRWATVLLWVASGTGCSQGEGVAQVLDDAAYRVKLSSRTNAPGDPGIIQTQSSSPLTWDLPATGVSNTGSTTGTPSPSMSGTISVTSGAANNFYARGT